MNDQKNRWLQVQEQRAISMREFIFRDFITKQITAALPKFLTADRFMRTCYTALLTNNKLLQVASENPQSLLSAMINAAQLGLEPVMGMAALVPYGKIIQFQPMYRGLVVLARRSGEIAKVEAEVVMWKDFFELSMGYESMIRHKMFEPAVEDALADPDNEDLYDRGPMRGAYTVWTFKDGVKSHTYMPRHDIFKIRDRAQAYRYALSHPEDLDAQKTPWLTDVEEMSKKTTVKRHSKLQPLSIEFMRAVALDDQAEAGLPQAVMSGADVFGFPEYGKKEEPGAPEGTGDGGDPGAPEGQDLKQEMAPEEKNFWTQVKIKKIEPKEVEDFLELCAVTKPRSEIIKIAMAKPENFEKFVEAMAKQKKKSGEDPGSGKEEKKKEEWTEADHLEFLKGKGKPGTIEYEKDWHDSIIKRAIGKDAMRVFLDKWQKYHNASYWDVGQPGGDALKKSRGPELAEHRPEGKSEEKKPEGMGRVEFVSKLKEFEEKLGEEVFYNKLGSMGYENATMIPMKSEFHEEVIKEFDAEVKIRGAANAYREKHPEEFAGKKQEAGKSDEVLICPTDKKAVNPATECKGCPWQEDGHCDIYLGWKEKKFNESANGV